MTAPTLNKSQQQKSQPPVSKEEQQQLDDMLHQMTADEIQVAAKASYEYLANPEAGKAKKYAQQYALRFLRAKDGDHVKALGRMKETLKFRTEIDVDGLRTAFDMNGNTEYAKKLEHEMRAQNVYVSGYDKDGRSTYVFVPRNVQGHDEDWTIKQHVYALERAVASSKAADKTVNAVVDFNGFSLRNAPPTHIGKSFMTTFRNHYAGAINGIFLIDAPLSFLCLWKIFKPLVGEKTRSKIHFVQSRKNELANFYEANEAAHWMMKGGKKNRELDTNEFLYKTAFDRSFDE